MSVNDTDSAKCTGLRRSSANDRVSLTLTGKFSGVIASTVNEIVSNSEISAILETPSASKIVSDSGTVLVPALLALSVSVIVSHT